jgi:hypothetical protein
VRPVVAVLLALLSAEVVAGCGSSDRLSQPSSNSTASTATTVLGRTAEEAIAAYLRSSGHEYAGDCGDTNLTDDAGKYCSVMHEDRGATRIYETGPTFSEFDTWLLLQQHADGWSVVDSAVAGTPDAPKPPPW